MKTLVTLLFGTLCAPLFAAPRPNVIFILADDLGYGDVRCYNDQSKVATPHMDRLAREGMRFTDAHSPATVCTPTRYSLRPGHPRIFADAESFRRIAAQCGKGGPLEPSYKKLLTMLDPRMASKNAYYPRNYCGPLFGFAYRVETDSGRDGSRFLQHLKKVCWKPDGSGIDGMDFGWDAIMYDWVHDALTPEERTLYGNPHDPQAANIKESEPDSKESDIDVCLWRMEVDPPDRSAEQHFLHVLIPYGDAAGNDGKTFSPQPGAFKLVEDASQEGVSLETAGGSWTVRFHRQGSPGGTVSVRHGAAPACAASLANEVRANATPPGLGISSKE